VSLPQDAQASFLETQDFGLDAERHVADFVEETGLVCLSICTRRKSSGSSLFINRKLTLQRDLRNGDAVDHREEACRLSGCEIKARATSSSRPIPADEDGSVCGGHPSDRFVDILHGFASAMSAPGNSRSGSVFMSQESAESPASRLV